MIARVSSGSRASSSRSAGSAESVSSTLAALWRPALRADHPLTARITLADVDYRGVHFPKDTVILACALTANRDPEAYGGAEAFDIPADRGRAKPLTFGAGPHFCLGANLARAELEEAFAFLAPRMKDLELAGEPVYDTPLGVHGLDELPISFTVAQSDRRAGATLGRQRACSSRRRRRGP